MSYDEKPIGYGERKPRELVPSGWHEVAIIGVYNVGRLYNNFTATRYPDKDPWQASLKLKMESSRKRADGKPIFIYFDALPSMHAKAWLRKVAEAVVGRDLTESEAASFKLSDMVGKPLSVYVSHAPKKTRPDEIADKVTNFAPSRDFYKPENEPELWDWRRSDPDDAPNWVWDLYVKSKDYKEPAKPRVPKPKTDLAKAAVAANADGAVSASVSTPVSGIEDPPF